MVGCSSPAIMRRVVVFPQPDGPRNTTNSRSEIKSETPSTAVTGPQCFVRFFKVTDAMRTHFIMLAGCAVGIHSNKLRKLSKLCFSFGGNLLYCYARGSRKRH